MHFQAVKKHPFKLALSIYILRSRVPVCNFLRFSHNTRTDSEKLSTENVTVAQVA